MVGRGMRKFKSIKQAQRFLNAHATVSSLFNLGRHFVSAKKPTIILPVSLRVLGKSSGDVEMA